MNKTPRRKTQPATPSQVMTWTDLNDPTGYRRRKEARREHYAKYVHGWKEIRCYACNGSGYYDNTGSPRCGGCEGTGKEKVSPAQYKIYMENERRYKAREEAYDREIESRYLS